MPETPPSPPPAAAQAPILVVGLVGGIGCGKSAVALRLAERGAEVLSADAMAHELLESPALREPLQRMFGTEVIAADGSVDRARIAKAVFGPAGQPQRQALEALLHPPILDRLAARVHAARAAPPPPDMLVLDVPLLAEHPSAAALCDRLVFVDCPQEQRESHCAARGWSAAEFAAREATQAPLAQKRVLARHTLDNSGTVAALHEKVDELYGGLLAAHRLAVSIALHGPRAHGGLGPATRAHHADSQQQKPGA